MQIGVIGINHKVADVSTREVIAKAFQAKYMQGHAFLENSYVLLSTCNRSELYFSADDLAKAHQEIIASLKQHIHSPFEQKLYTFFGIDCFMHLAKVCTGLDSAIVAETEIQGQVKSSYAAAVSMGRCSKDHHFLFQKCLKIAKETRQSFEGIKNLPDLEHALLHAAREYFDYALPRPLFIGASQINLKIARFFASKGVRSMTLCNRSDEVRPIIDEQHTTEFLPWNRLSSEWRRFDWIICATKCPHLILNTPDQSTNSKKLLIDLSVPRNIAPDLQTSHTKLLNIDDLQALLQTRQQALEQKVYSAEVHINVQVRRLIQKFHQTKENYSLPICLPLGVAI